MLAATIQTPIRRLMVTWQRVLWSGDRGSCFGLGLRGLGLPHGVGVIDLGLRLGVILLGVGDHLLGLLHQALGLRRELHRLGLEKSLEGPDLVDQAIRQLITPNLHLAPAETLQVGQ